MVYPIIFMHLYLQNANVPQKKKNLTNLASFLSGNQYKMTTSFFEKCCLDCSDVLSRMVQCTRCCQGQNKGKQSDQTGTLTLWSCLNSFLFSRTFKYLPCWFKVQQLSSVYLALVYSNFFYNRQVPLNYSLHNTLVIVKYCSFYHCRNEAQFPLFVFGKIALTKGSRIAHVATALAQPHLTPASQFHIPPNANPRSTAVPQTYIFPHSKAFLAYRSCHAQYLFARCLKWQFPSLELSTDDI